MGLYWPKLDLDVSVPDLVAKYMEHRKEMEQEAAAAKAGISMRSARRIEHAGVRRLALHVLRMGGPKS